MRELVTRREQMRRQMAEQWNEARLSTGNPLAPCQLVMSTDPRSLGDMFADLTRETRTLIQQEMHLAKTELSQNASRLVPSLTMIVVGGLIAYGGLLAIVAAVVLGLIAIGLAAWAAALLGGLVVAGIGYALIRAGLASFRPQDLAPRQTMETLKEDARWLKTQTR
jgi:predicted phage tail protein